MDIIKFADIKKMVQLMSDCIIRNEQAFCELDSAAGDGDFGSSVAKGFRKLAEEWDSMPESDIGAFLLKVGNIIMKHCGGASGPIWGNAFRSAGKLFSGKEEMSIADLADALITASQAIQKIGGAQEGDKTLLDALIPAGHAIKKYSEEGGSELRTALDVSAKAATEGAEKTKEMVAKRGRASYVGERSLKYPDAGAAALAIIFTEIAEEF